MALRAERAAQRGAGGDVRMTVDASRGVGQDGVRGRARHASRSAACRSSATTRSASCAAIASASSVRTDPARRRCCGCWSASSSRTRARSASGARLADRLLRSAARAARSGAHGRRQRQRRQRHGRSSTASRGTSSATSPTSCFRASARVSPVKSLSGGERNRLLLARLFARPANVLVLDEPTNDLDIETLELLEELVGDFAGTVLLVSHDRVVPRPRRRPARWRSRAAAASPSTSAAGQDYLRQSAASGGSAARPRPRRAAAARARRSRLPRRRRLPTGAARAEEAVVQGTARVRSAAGAHRGARGRAAAADAGSRSRRSSTRQAPDRIRTVLARLEQHRTGARSGAGAMARARRTRQELGADAAYASNDFVNSSSMALLAVVLELARAGAGEVRVGDHRRVSPRAFQSSPVHSNQPSFS